MGEIKINCAKVGMIGTNCYLVYDEDLKETVIIDPGDNGAFLVASIDRMGLKPVAIFLTHAHFDHIGAVKELRERYDLPVYIHSLDRKMLEDPDINMSGSISIELTDRDVLLEGGETLNVGGMEFKVIATPGHTPGGTCYYMENENILFAGDTMFRFSWGRTDFPGGSERDLMESIRTKLLPLPEETIVYPGHEGPTSIKNERMTHGYTV